MRFEHIDHTLAIGDVYFTLQPLRWMFEHQEKFEHEKRPKPYVWEPDFIGQFGKKIYCGEVQLKSLSKKEWEDKWSIYNMFFESAYAGAVFQEWSNKETAIKPQFMVITSQKFAAEGFNIKGRELLVVNSANEFLNLISSKLA